MTEKKVFSGLTVVSQWPRVVGATVDNDYTQANTEKYSLFLPVWDVYNNGDASPPPLLKVGWYNVRALIDVSFIIFLFQEYLLRQYTNGY